MKKVFLSLAIVFLFFTGCDKNNASTSEKKPKETSVRISVNKAENTKTFSKQALSTNYMQVEVFTALNSSDESYADKTPINTKAFTKVASEWTVSLNNLQRNQYYIFVVTAFSSNEAEASQLIFKGIKTHQIVEGSNAIKINLTQTDNANNVQNLPSASNIVATTLANGTIELSFNISNPYEEALTWEIRNDGTSSKSDDFSSNSGETNTLTTAITLNYLETTYNQYLLLLSTDDATVSYHFSVNIEGVSVIDLDNPEHLAILGVPKIEVEALLAFANDNTLRLHNPITDEYVIQEPFPSWNKLTPVSEWDGISVEDGHVSKLTPYILYLPGILSKELGNLSELKILNLNEHSFTGTIPKELGSLGKLELLDLGNIRNRKTQLAGTIPKELGNLSSLKTLRLDHNSLTGQIPEALTNLPNLKELDLRFNSLVGAVPTFNNANFIMGINDNAFVFQDLEENYESATYTNATDQFLSPQSVVDSNEIKPLINFGATLEIVPKLEENPSNHDSYQWYKDGVELIGATSRIYKKENVSKADSGLYTYKVSNSVVTGLTLDSHTIGEGISIEVTNQAPLGTADEIQTAIGSFISIDVLSNDRDADTQDELEIAAGSLSTPSDGTAEVKEGRIEYTPNEDFIGTDSFTYRVSDGTNESEDITVTIHVQDIGRPFIFIQETINKQITFKTYRLGDYNVTIDWGDGGISQNISSTTSHIYDADGNKTIKIFGTYPQPVLGAGSLISGESAYTQSLQSIEQWGDIKWKSMLGAFRHCKNLRINATDKPNLDEVTSLESMFEGASSFNTNINDWDVSNVTNMFSMFEGASSFNQTLDSWDISNVGSMTNMLKDTNLSTENYNKLLNAWSLIGVQDNITFSAYPTQYSTEASNARDILIHTNHWTITDGGNKDDTASSAKTLLASYNFDDCTANDSSGNGHDGTLVGPTCEETATRGHAMRFDGNDAIHINVPINGSGDWSMCMWYNLDVGSPSGYKDLISGDNRFTVSIKDLYHEIYASFSKLSSDAKDASELEGIDTFVCYIKEDSNLSIYLNAGLEKRNTNGANINVENLTHIGRWNSSANEYFHGLLDEIKIYQGALSETEMQNLFLESGVDAGGLE